MKRLMILLGLIVTLAGCSSMSQDDEVEQNLASIVHDGAKVEGENEIEESVELEDIQDYSLTKEEALVITNEIVSNLQLNEYIDRIETRTDINWDDSEFIEVRIFTSFDENTLSIFNISLTAEEVQLVYDTMINYCNDLLNNIIEKTQGFDGNITVVYSNEKDEMMNTYPMILLVSRTFGEKKVREDISMGCHQELGYELKTLRASQLD